MTTNEDFIKHVGVLGMKWGRRKSSSGGSSDHITVSSLRKKRLQDMSNDDLKKLTSRMELERKYRDLRSADASKARKWLSGTLSSAGSQVASKYVASALEKGGLSLFELLNKQLGRSG